MAKYIKFIKYSTLLVITLLLSQCITPPPSNVNQLCRIFKQYPSWYRAAKDVERRWKVPVEVQMAIIHQESKFDALAEPPRTKLLGVVPWKKPSTASGYTQALTTTWALYRRQSGNLLASRSSFTDAVDFIGWYANMANRYDRIPRNNAYLLYLAYHEGTGGYLKKTYLRKPWLIHVAHKVAAKTALYKVQLAHCNIS